MSLRAPGRECADNRSTQKPERYAPIGEGKPLPKPTSTFVNSRLSVLGTLGQQQVATAGFIRGESFGPRDSGPELSRRGPRRHGGRLIEVSPIAGSGERRSAPGDEGCSTRSDHGKRRQERDAGRSRYSRIWRPESVGG